MAKEMPSVGADALRPASAESVFDGFPPVDHSLLSVQQARHESLPLSEQLQWLVDLLGQLWLGFVYMLAGQPGRRKSGLSLQVALDLAQRGRKVLFILTEEPASRLLERALRMMSAWPAGQVRRTLSNLTYVSPTAVGGNGSKSEAFRRSHSEELTSTYLANLLVEENSHAVGGLPSFLGMNVLAKTGKFHGVSLIVLDSIQGQRLSSNATAEWEQLYEFFRLCQMARITVLAVCHSTKRHDAAGPQSLQHNVDAVLILRSMIRCRLLFVVKNRGGPASVSSPT